MLLAAFRFSGVELYQRQRERATGGKKSSDRGQRQRENATQHRARLKILTSYGLKRSVPINYTPDGTKRNNGKNKRLHGSPLESQAGATTEKSQNKKIPHNFATILSGNCRGESVVLSYNGYYENVVFRRQILLHFCMCYFCRWILTTT